MAMSKTTDQLTPGELWSTSAESLPRVVGPDELWFELVEIVDGGFVGIESRRFEEGAHGRGNLAGHAPLKYGGIERLVFFLEQVEV